MRGAIVDLTKAWQSQTEAAITCLAAKASHQHQHELQAFKSLPFSESRASRRQESSRSAGLRLRRSSLGAAQEEQCGQGGPTCLATLGSVAMDSAWSEAMYPNEVPGGLMP